MSSAILRIAFMPPISAIASVWMFLPLTGCPFQADILLKYLTSLSARPLKAL